jgi:hypothetical protein
MESPAARDKIIKLADEENATLFKEWNRRRHSQACLRTSTGIITCICMTGYGSHCFKNSPVCSFGRMPSPSDKEREKQDRRA